MSDEVLARVVAFVRSRRVAASRSPDVTADTPLLDGFLDSVDVFELQLFVEDLSGRTVASEDVTPERFGTPSLVAAFVMALSKERCPA